jgi:metalloendopeptidase OMA1, mitochondrial
MKPAPWMLLGLAVALLGGCYTVPETGRRSLMLVSSGEELQLGASEFKNVQSQQRVSADPALNARVRRVGERIARAVGGDLPSAQWEFVVFDDPAEINAFALPGGKVGVYSGLLRVARTDDELAVVMGHEIGHVTARHGSERLSQALLVALGGLALDAGLKDSRSRDTWLAAYGAGATVGLVLPYSRLNENEADEIGLIYAAKAGYDPRAGITFWQRMLDEGKGKAKLPPFLSTHPTDERRIEHLRSLMPKVLPVYEQHRNDR